MILESHWPQFTCLKICEPLGIIASKLAISNKILFGHLKYVTRHWIWITSTARGLVRQLPLPLVKVNATHLVITNHESRNLIELLATFLVKLIMNALQIFPQKLNKEKNEALNGENRPLVTGELVEFET